jgi:hypothetical protein
MCEVTQTNMADSQPVLRPTCRAAWMLRKCARCSFMSIFAWITDKVRPFVNLLTLLRQNQYLATVVLGGQVVDKIDQILVLCQHVRFLQHSQSSAGSRQHIVVHGGLQQRLECGCTKQRNHMNP